MIILINGPFGVGKTTVAEHLLQFIDQAHIYDPEILGKSVVELTEGVRKESECTDDFQDVLLWELLVIDTARHLIEQYAKTLLVPMTFDNASRLQNVVHELEVLAPVHHFCLRASYETIQQRLQKRGEHNGDWPQRRAKECCERQRGKAFECYIDTESLTIEEVSLSILTHLDE